MATNYLIAIRTENKNHYITFETDANRQSFIQDITTKNPEVQYATSQVKYK